MIGDLIKKTKLQVKETVKQECSLILTTIFGPKPSTQEHVNDLQKTT